MEAVFPMVIILLVVGTIWMGIYCYGLYRLGRLIANRYRTRPYAVFGLITLGSAVLSSLCLLIHVDIIWQAVIVFSVWIAHTQAIGSGFWAGMELGKRADETLFKQRTEEWLREWEQPVTRGRSEDAD